MQQGPCRVDARVPLPQHDSRFHRETEGGCNHETAFAVRGEACFELDDGSPPFRLQAPVWVELPAERMMRVEVYVQQSEQSKLPEERARPVEGGDSNNPIVLPDSEAPGEDTQGLRSRVSVPCSSGETSSPTHFLCPPWSSDGC